MAEKKQISREGLNAYEEELHYLEHVRMKEISEKIGEAREQGDLSENAEYDAAKDEQRNVKARIDELKELLKNVEVVEGIQSTDQISFGSTVKVQDVELKEELQYTIKGTSEADVLKGVISNESPLGRALIGAKKKQTVLVDAPDGVLKYKVMDFWVENK